MDKMREEFKVWFKREHRGNLQQIDGEYVHGATERLWQAWQASRKALIVELPQPNNDGEDSLMRRVEIALDKAGVNY